MAKLKGKYIEDATIAEVKLDVFNAPTDGYVLEWDNTEGKMKWATAGGTDAHDVFVSANDTTAGFLNGKLVIDSGKTTLTENNDGANETLTLGIGADIFDHVTDNSDVITEGSSNLFLTTAERTLLGNTTNTNSGDVSVTDSAEIDLTLTGQDITATIVASSIDETKLDTSVNASLDLADTSVQNTGDETIAGIKTFSSFSITPSTAPTTDYQVANKLYVDDILAANDAMVYKGVIDASTNPNYPAADAGDTYKISVAGKIGGASGVDVEVGDMVICLVDSTSTGDHATVGANWNVIQVNIDGYVLGPASAVSDNLATYDGTTGDLIKDSGLLITNVFDKSTDDTDDITVGTAKFVTASDLTNIGNLSGTNSGDEVVAIGSELDTGTDDIKYASALALANSKYVLSDETATFTNKTFDANATGNSLSNVDVADLANGTDGELITWSATGVAATVSTGSDTHVLTSNGAGTAPTFQAVPAAGGETNNVVIVTLDATDITNKYNDDLVNVPVTASAVNVCPVGGIPQEYGVDFTVITDGADIKRINWSALGLDGILVAGDKLIVTYTY